MSGADLRAAVASTPWYHTLELPGGAVTPGFYDLRRLPARLPLPSSLAGRRCLDVGTANGFWAYEMERRGAREVVAIDLDDQSARDWQGGRPPAPELLARTPRPEAFRIAHAALGSRVQRLDLSVHDLSPAGHGEFDFVFAGSLLLHLRDPVGALAAIRGVARGELLCLDAISPVLSLLAPRRPLVRFGERDDTFWWAPNVAALRRWVRAAGLSPVAAGGPVAQPFGAGAPGRRPPQDRGPLHALQWLALRRVGNLCGWVLARRSGS